MSERKVLVIGGSGFLGRRITEAFAHNEDAVSVLARGRTPLGVDGNVELIEVDRHHADALRTAIGSRTFDVVVDNIAYGPEDVRSVLDVIEDRAAHYLLTSSCAVYSDRYVRRPIREQEADLSLRVPVDAPNPYHSRQGHGYANNKRSAEQLLSDAKTPWTVLRAPVILGADDRTLRVWWFVQRLLDGEPILIPDWGPGRIFQVVWANDVARAFVAAAGNPAAFGHTYNVAQSEIYTAESWVEACAAVLGVRARYAHIDEDQLDAVGLAGYALPIAGRPFGHLLVDASAIRRELGFDAAAENVWLAETIRGCAAHPPAGNSLGYERRASEVLTAHAVATAGAGSAGKEYAGERRTWS